MESLILPLLLLFVFGPPIATLMWRRTKAVWIPSALLLGCSIYLFSTAREEPTGGPPLSIISDSGVAQIVLGFAFFNAAIALVASIVHHWRRSRGPSTPPSETLPRAIVHRDDV
jgi:hypothetical protein